MYPNHSRGSQNLRVHKTHQENSVKTQVSGFHLQTFWFAGSGVSPGFCFSYKLSSDTGAAGPKATPKWRCFRPVRLWNWVDEYSSYNKKGLSFHYVVFLTFWCECWFFWTPWSLQLQITALCSLAVKKATSQMPSDLTLCPAPHGC